ncbi:ATP-binding protein, partial [Candidatus Bathyarchaeota archaeon]|nr:ATP-binding protein [Candidatus Bathyarchaeota archaeon]
PPLIAGFVGADCVAATLATSVHKENELSFLMDIGTNTEIVVGKKEGLAACSCASGPAFEGAHIKHGMRAASGAIEGVWIAPESLEPRIKVIDDSLAMGICGSGLIDLLSEMLKSGIMDSSGKIINRDHKRIRKYNGVSEYVVAWRGDTGIDSDIVITQLDVRELQKGKAAIYSGAKTLMKKLGVIPSDFKNIYMAGAFGTYINRESALNIGMIPEFSLSDIQQVGNAAGTGARMALLSRKARLEAQVIREKTEYVELATSKEYNRDYLDALLFPHMDLDLFPETVRKLDSTNWVKGRIHSR